jgi:hypothetical protein
MLKSLAIVAAACAALITACDSTHQKCADYGRACGSDGDCECGQCVADPEQDPADLQPLALVCGEEQSGAGDAGERCGQASDCRRGICLLAGTCALACDKEEQCGALARCASVYARAAESALQPLRACVPLADLPPGGEVKSRVRRKFFDGSGALLPLDLPAVEPTTVFVLEHLAADAWPAFTPCRSPICIDALRTKDAEPTTLFDVERYADYWQDDEKAPLNPVDTGSAMVGAQGHPVTILLPNGPRSILSGAGFRAELEAETAGDLRVTELSASAPGSRLDLNLFYVGGGEWTPAGKRGPELLAKALDRFDQIYSQAGISIGEVRQIEVKGGLRDRFEFIALRYGVLEDLPHLFELSAGAGNPAINLFLVRELGSEQGATLAISGGTPGPLGMHGTGASGIAISADLFDDADRLGKVIAHEVGHYLGLFHPSESCGVVLDPLPDTPECRLSRDANGDAELSAAECEGYGADNLMFWAITDDFHISDEQAELLRSAIILK